MTSRGAWLVLVLALLSGSAEAQSFKREELRVPAPGAGKQGLQVLFVKPDLPGRLPLVVITHGSPRKPEDRKISSPFPFLAVATEFARRGWAVAIVMRRGYGGSGGDHARPTGPCERPNYEALANAGASDLRATITYIGKRADIDSSRLLAVGGSTGGLVVAALTSEPPPGLLAGINFAGGARGIRDGKFCEPRADGAVAAFKTFGKRSRTPMLWIYSENDSLFPPEFAQRFKDAFSAGGGKVEFVKAPPFRSDGHILMLSGVLQWTPYVDEFFRQRDLVILETPLPVPQLIPTPPRLSADGQRSFEEFLLTPPQRALAVSPSGAIGWHAGGRSVEDAKKSALASCAKHAADCRIVVVNDEAMPQPPLPDIAPPKQLNADGRTSFEKFLNSPHHRAFAVSRNGSYGWRSRNSTAEEASKLALEGCAKHASDCRIVVINDKAMPLPPLPDIAPPKQLNAAGRTSFEKFLNSPHHRAFAVSPNGSYGWRSGHSTVEEASKQALEGCAKQASDCVIVVVDDKAAP